MRIVLASKSPRRREILNNIGLKFDVIESNAEEKIEASDTPDEIVKKLAYRKAEKVSENLEDGALVIGADTIVVLGSRIMGKPKDEEQAFDMLSALSGVWHKVYTGLCIINTSSGACRSDYEVTEVKMGKFSSEDIRAYIRSGEPMDKAGSYAIQGLGSLLVERIDGCYYNVVGMPVFKLSQMLERFGVHLLSSRG